MKKVKTNNKNGCRYIYLLLLVLTGCAKERHIEETNTMAYNNQEPVAIGCEGADYDDWTRSAYVLPYPIGKSHVVNLSHCAGSYHSAGEPDEFAIDFEMPIGTHISASRAGRVVRIEESGVDGNFPNNVVVVQHADNTFAQYMHLTNKGVFVKVGDEVEQGQIIALSGNTGLAGYPHLHFVVTDGSYAYPYKSVPTTFKNTSPNERSLASWTRYTALPY